MYRWFPVCALMFVGALVSCSSTRDVLPDDRAVLEKVVSDSHFSEWTRCDGTTYRLRPVSAPPAYERGKPFFFSNTEIGKSSLKHLPLELLTSLQTRNATETQLPHLRVRIPLASDEDTPAYVWLSRPGYDNAQNAAVAVTRNSAGNCAAAGYVVLLRRSGAEWIIGDRPVEWVE
jgi:hypothetical protein